METNAKVNDFRKLGKLCDITLIVGDVEFPANKIILCGFSPFFEAMFLGEFIEAEKNRITLESVDASTMENVLDYAYTGKATITEENVQIMFKAANFFQAKQLVEICSHFMKYNLKAENCLSVLELSQVYSCAELKEKAKAFVIKNFLAVSRANEFLELNADRVVFIIEEDSLDVEREEVVFNAVMRWFYHKEDERRADLPLVLRYVRLTSVNLNFLYSCVQSQKALRSSTSVVQLMQEVQWYHMLPHLRTTVYNSFTRRRNCSSDMEVLLVRGWSHISGKDEAMLVSGEGEVIKRVKESDEFYSFWSAFGHTMYALNDEGRTPLRKWDIKTDLYMETELEFDDVREDCRTVLFKLNDDWYSFGEDGERWDFCPERYDLTSNKWIKITPLLEAVVNPAVVGLDGLIYVIGGTTKSGAPSDSIQSYDPSTDTWTQITSWPAPRKEPRACALNGQIFVFSVWNEEGFDRRVDMYDVSTSTWKQCADIPQLLVSDYDPHIFEEPVVLGGKIYMVTKPLDCETYTLDFYLPSTDTWQKCPLQNFVPHIVKGPLLFKRPK